MAYDNSGILSKNDRKEQEKHPDYKGSATINGTEYWLSAWVKQGSKGKFFSLAFKPKEQRRESQVEEPQGGGGMDDVPF